MSRWDSASIEEYSVGDRIQVPLPTWSRTRNGVFDRPPQSGITGRASHEPQGQTAHYSSNYVSNSDRSHHGHKTRRAPHASGRQSGMRSHHAQHNGSQLLHSRTGSPLSRRRPLARLPENSLLPHESLLPSDTEKHHQPPVTRYHRQPRGWQPSDNNPRRLLWPPAQTRQLLPAISIRHPDINQRLPHRNFRLQKTKPLVVRNEFRTISSIRQDFQAAAPGLQTITEGRKLSSAQQRYTPINDEQSEMLRKSSQTRYHLVSTHKMIQQGTNYAQHPLIEERRPSLMERFVQKLPESPPTLHAPDSRLPPNPGSPRASSPVQGFTTIDRDDAPNSTILAPETPTTQPPALMRKMLRWEIWLYRIVFGAIIIVLNISILTLYLMTPKHHYLLAFLVFMKSKDLLSTVAGIFGVLWYTVRDALWKPPDVDSRWIMSIVCAYAETEGQIMKTIETLVKQELVQHKQVISIILDGKPRNVLQHFTRITHTMERPYTTWKGIRGDLQIHAGWIKNTPVILIQKVKNGGKKDTLILGHSLFNYPRDDVPMDVKLIRQDIFAHILPDLTGVEAFKSFDYVYATDADSIIHKDCLKELANALARNPKAIAACGIILAELEDGTEWSAWHLFQQFQYTFGQYIRRQAESMWGRVTCLPGPVTMISVRKEMGKAISEYAAPITTANLFLHQVQYQGTDRRLTWCMLAQGKHLQTILVTKAIGETVVPSTLDHYLSQRRRWAANAYFNDYMYAFGKNQHLITRLFGIIDIVRMSFVYYRVMNTALFIRSLIRVFYMLKIIPTLIMTKSPTVWFLLVMLIKEPLLRNRLHKLLAGIALNQFMSPILSVIVFSRVLLNMGNHAWGKTGVSSRNTLILSATSAVPPIPTSPWSPKKLVKIIKNAIDHPLPQLVHPEPTEKACTALNEDLSTPPSTAPTSPSDSTILEESVAHTKLSAPTTPLSEALDWSVSPVRSSLSTNASFNPDSAMRKRTRQRNEPVRCRIPAGPVMNSIFDEPSKS